MKVVWHKAVGNNCKPFIVGGAQDLRASHINARLIHEQLSPVIRAECQEISVKTDVIESLQMARRAVRMHGLAQWSFQVLVRLNADATFWSA